MPDFEKGLPLRDTDPSFPAISVDTSLEGVVAAALEKVLAKKDSLLGLSTEQLKTMLFNIISDKMLASAMEESGRSNRIFADVEGIKTAGTTPFRIKSVDQLRDVVKNLESAIIPKKSHLVMAVCIVQAETYTTLPK